MSSSGVIPIRPYMARLLAVLFVLVLGAGCVMPKGRQVIVDRRVPGLFTGDAVLLEISEDRASCLVAVRGNTLTVEKRWVPCAYVHSRPLDPI